MSARTPTLAEFLLERIAEDKANLLRLVDPLEFVDDSCTNRWVDRVRAECEAKKRIIETYTYTYDTRAWIDDEVGDPDMNDVMGPLRDVMRALALPYASHPDFREDLFL